MTALCLLFAIAALDLQPPPQQMTLDQKRVFQLRPTTPVVVARPDDPGALAMLDPLMEALAFRPTVQSAERRSGREPAILIGELGAHPAFEERANRRALRDVPAQGPEGYFLRITQDGVLLAGNTPRGTYHGIVTLAQIARQSGSQWPCLEIRDQPALAVRAALLTHAPSEAELDALAAAHCNMVIFDTPGFQFLDADRAVPWKEVFAQARARQIEPVPSFHLFHDAAKLIAFDARAAEGRNAAEALVLKGYEPVFLKEPRPIITAASPGKVTVSGMTCEPGVDYDLASLADDGRGLWTVRRVSGSRIPDGATVQVHYGVVPEGTEALCPVAQETEALLRDAVERLVRELAPECLYVGPDRITRLNEDARCTALGVSDAKLLAEGLRMLDRVTQTERPGLRLLISGRATFPDGTPLPWPPPADLLPKNALLISYGSDSIAVSGELLGVDGNASQAYRRAQEATLGMLVSGEHPPLLNAGLSRAWNPVTPVLAWPHGLNEYFGASLWRPEFEVRLDAIIAHVNRELRRGASPKELRSAFDTLYGRLQRPLAGDPELAATQAVFHNVIDYLELEAAYRQESQRASLAKLVSLVERQAALDPRIDRERLDRIVQTIDHEGLFVPASILFGTALDYYRPMPSPEPGSVVLPMPVTPEYRDLPFRTEAHFALDDFPCRIVRINFETVASDRVLLEDSADGVQFSPRQTWSATAPDGVHGPVLPDALADLSRFRIVAESRNQTAVLREVALLAIKPPAFLRCPYRTDAGASLRAAMRAADWPTAAVANGFVREDGSAFAEAPTTARIARGADRLYCYFVAHEPRMHALSATLTTRDAALWEEESVEIRIQTTDGTPLRFAVNPLGTQFDARRGDTAWDADWTVETRTEAAAWTAFITLPTELLDSTTGPRTLLRIDFLRNRHNAIAERSHWAMQPDDGTPAYGELTFE